ncbi:DNA-binding protein [Marinithermofilum abyssi]|uniref:DNA-binding protein n=1 Tax=Marinithermofilum abyssi TaxID=1571185 RepID=A0A8J2YCZ3_9BACL|nr:Myb-like DNA-binding domain-containing protein [Marinithermofilum abyssi]GGE20035.1 DNA-binding protein [Marinithermofilum abyssi]
MKGRRWTEEEDRLLAEVVLQAVHEGRNQLEAFEVVGKKIGRTPGACGFRWNAVVRKREAEAFRKAKKQRIASQLNKKRGGSQNLREVIRQLQAYNNEYRNFQESLNKMERRLKEKDWEYRQVSEEHARLSAEWEAIYQIRAELKERYASLLKLLQSAQQAGSGEAVQKLDASGLSFIKERAEDDECGSEVDTNQERET